MCELTRKVFMLHREKEFILFFIHESGEELMISTLSGEISEVLAHLKVPVKKLDRRLARSSSSGRGTWWR